MPGCGDNESCESGGLIDANPLTDPFTPVGSFLDKPSPDTNKPFVRDLDVGELEELIEKCVRRVLAGEDIRREYERLKATEKPR